MSLIQKEQASHLRQDMHNLMARMRSLVEEMMERGPLVKGTIYERKRRCGRRGCHCEEGFLHVSDAFSYSDAGKTKHVRLDGVDHKQLGQCVRSYRRFRAARARLCKDWQILLALVDEMESVRRIPFEDLFRAPVQAPNGKGGEGSG